jgi:hypothetical protein
MSLRTRLPLFVLVLGSAAATADEDPAVAAARTREQSVRTARFEVHVREVHAKGARSDRAGVTVRTPVPAEEMTVESDQLLILAGNKVRVETDHPMWTGTRFGPPCRCVVVSDEELRTTFFLNGVGPDRTPQGMVERSVGTSAADSLIWAPVRMTCRGLTVGPDLLSRLEAGETTEAIGGDRCREYTAPGRAQTLYWLAPDKEYVVRRVRDVEALQVTRQTDIRYRRDDAVGWLPSDWTLTEYGRDGRTLVTTTVTAAAVRLNEPVPDGTFRVNFPPGTLVSDSAIGKSYRVGPDGTWREEDPAALIRPGGDPPPAEPLFPWRRALVAGLGLAVGLGALLTVWLRLRRTPGGSLVVSGRPVLDRQPRDGGQVRVGGDDGAVAEGQGRRGNLDIFLAGRLD